MMEGLDVGVANIADRVGSGGMVLEVDDLEPAERVLYPSVDKPLLVIPAGSMCIITAYNLAYNEIVKIHRVLRTNGIPEHAESGCCPKRFVGNSVTLRSVYTGWDLKFEKPIFIVKTPGNYEIELFTDVPVAGVEDNNALVTAVTYPLQPVNSF